MNPVTPAVLAVMALAADPQQACSKMGSAADRAECFDNAQAQDSVGFSSSLNVKGVILGTLESEAVAQLGPGASCGTVSSAPKEQPTNRMCARPTSTSDSFAGVPVQRLHYWSLDQRIEAVSISLPPTAFESVVEALSAKYGQPIMTTNVVKNLSGAELENAVATWTSPSGDRIELRRFGHTVHYAPLWFTSAAYEASRSRLLNAHRAAATGDM